MHPSARAENRAVFEEIIGYRDPWWLVTSSVKDLLRVTINILDLTRRWAVLTGEKLWYGLAEVSGATSPTIQNRLQLLLINLLLLTLLT